LKAGNLMLVDMLMCAAELCCKVQMYIQACMYALRIFFVIMYMLAAHLVNIYEYFLFLRQVCRSSCSPWPCSWRCAACLANRFKSLIEAHMRVGVCSVCVCMCWCPVVEYDNSCSAL
jgi:hypothetical protein